MRINSTMIIPVRLGISLFILCLLRPAAGAATERQFTLVRQFLIVVPVRLNDRVTADFLLDTGTNTTLVQTEFARQLGLQARDRMELVTTAGSQIVPRASLPALACAEKTVRNLEVLVSDLAEVRTVLPNVRGVLGQNFLSQFNFLVDFDQRRISFQDEPEAGWCGVEVPFIDSDNRILITVASGQRMLLDSAIAELMFFTGKSQTPEATLFAEGLTRRQFRSDAGSGEVWQGKLRRFAIGNLLFTDVPVNLLAQSPQEMQRSEDGLLPLSLFRAVYFDHRQHRLLLNPLRRPANLSPTPPSRAVATTPRSN